MSVEIKDIELEIVTDKKEEKKEEDEVQLSPEEKEKASKASLLLMKKKPKSEKEGKEEIQESKGEEKKEPETKEETKDKDDDEEDEAATKKKKAIGGWISNIVMFALPVICIIIMIVAGEQKEPMERDLPCKLNVYSTNATNSYYSNLTDTIYIENPEQPVNTTIDCTHPNFQAKYVTPGGWKIALSIIPFIVIFEGILGLKLSSKIVAPIGLVITVIIGVIFFPDSKEYINDTLPGVMGKIALTIIDRFLWTIFDYALNMFSALFFLEVCKQWGILERIRIEFEQITTDPNRLILLVVYCFGMVLAVVAPGGTNYMIAGAILIKMNLKPKVSPEDAKRIVGEYDERHKDDKNLKNVTEEDKLRIDSNNRIAAICLFGNALSSAFNLLGVCVIATASVVSPFDLNPNGLSEEELDKHAAKEIGRTFSAMMFIFGIISVYIMNTIYSKRKWIWQRLADPEMSPSDWIISTIIGFVFSGVQYIIAGYVGPELPCLLAGGICLILYVIIEKAGDMRHRRWPKKGDRRYLIPFLILMVVLILLRLIPGLEDYLTGTWSEKAGEVMAPKFKLGGYSKVDFPWIIHSGVIVSVIALLTPAMVTYRKPETTMDINYPVEKSFATASAQIAKMETVLKAIRKFKKPIQKNRSRAEKLRLYREVLVNSFKETMGETGSIIVSITAFGSIAKLMASFEMTQTIALAIVDALRPVPVLFAFVIPLIGMLGSGLTGSTTTSNFLFGKLQVGTALELGLISPGRNSIYEVTAAQMLGSTTGEIISPMNAIVVILMDGVDKKESDLIRDVLPIALIWLVLTMLTSGLFIAPSSGFID